MTGKTHMAVGAMLALVTAGGAAPGTLLTAALGGALGGYLPDTDIRVIRKRRHPVRCWLVCLGLVIALALGDALTDATLFHALAAQPGERVLTGMLGLTALMLLGARTGHRGLTHSLTGTALAIGAVWLMLPPLTLPFALGYISHLALDLTNHKPLRLLYPLRRGFALGLCDENGLCDRLLLCVALLGCVGRSFI